MTTPKISKEVSDLLTPDDLRDAAGDGDTLPRETLKKPDPLDKLLTPRDLLDVPDKFAGTVKELIPDALRTPDDDVEAELQTKAEKEPDGEHEVRISLGEWAEKWAKAGTAKAENEKFEQEIEARKVEDENAEIKESFRRVAAKMKVDDLTPDTLRDD